MTVDLSIISRLPSSLLLIKSPYQAKVALCGVFWDRNERTNIILIYVGMLILSLCTWCIVTHVQPPLDSVYDTRLKPEELNNQCTSLISTYRSWTEQHLVKVAILVPKLSADDSAGTISNFFIAYSPPSRHAHSVSEVDLHKTPPFIRRIQLVQSDITDWRTFSTYEADRIMKRQQDIRESNIISCVFF